SCLTWIGSTSGASLFSPIPVSAADILTNRFRSDASSAAARSIVPVGPTTPTTEPAATPSTLRRVKSIIDCPRAFVQRGGVTAKPQLLFADCFPAAGGPHFPFSHWAFSRMKVKSDGVAGTCCVVALPWQDMQLDDARGTLPWL